MTRPKSPAFVERLQEAAARGYFGAQGAAVAATLARVENLTNDQVERLVQEQRRVDDPSDIRFFNAWHGVYARARGPEVLAFQSTVSWSYSAADRRLGASSLAAEFSPGRANDFRRAVAGRSLALIAGPDAPADDLMALSAAWSKVVG